MKKEDRIARSDQKASALPVLSMHLDKKVFPEAVPKDAIRLSRDTLEFIAERSLPGEDLVHSLKRLCCLRVELPDRFSEYTPATILLKSSNSLSILIPVPAVIREQFVMRSVMGEMMDHVVRKVIWLKATEASGHVRAAELSDRLWIGRKPGARVPVEVEQYRGPKNAS